MNNSSTCPLCDAVLPLAPEHLGRRVRCPKCRGVFQVGAVRGPGRPSAPAPAVSVPSPPKTSAGSLRFRRMALILAVAVTAACNDDPLSFDNDAVFDIVTNPSAMTVPAGAVVKLATRAVNQGGEPTWHKVMAGIGGDVCSKTPVRQAGIRENALRITERIYRIRPQRQINVPADLKRQIHAVGIVLSRRIEFQYHVHLATRVHLDAYQAAPESRLDGPRGGCPIHLHACDLACTQRRR